eukprot:COSAG01_NODE_10724_length_2095_cov_1.018036_1_plen_68_part_10
MIGLAGGYSAVACAAIDMRCPGLLIAYCFHAKCRVDSRALAPPLCPGGIGHSSTQIFGISMRVAKEAT